MQVLLNLQMPVMQCKNAQIIGSKLNPNLMKVKLYNDKCMVSILWWMSVCLVCIFASISLYVFTFLNEFIFSHANQSDCTSYCQGEDVGFRPPLPLIISLVVSPRLSPFFSHRPPFSGKGWRWGWGHSFKTWPQFSNQHVSFSRIWTDQSSSNNTSMSVCWDYRIPLMFHVFWGGKNAAILFCIFHFCCSLKVTHMLGCVSSAKKLWLMQ